MDISELKDMVIKRGFNFSKRFSFVRNIMKKEQIKMENELEHDLKIKSRQISNNLTQLPQKGRSHEEIISLMKTVTKTEDQMWENGKLSGSVYHGKREHQKLLNEAFSLYSLSNPIHPEIWPSVMKYEAEIISMAASLVNGGVSTVCGATTSGGTESIILAIKSHRDYWREYHGIHEPELICGVSAHAAVDKACELLNIKLIKVKLTVDSYEIDLHALESAITANTIMLYGSAPSYPQGAIDDITALSKLAIKYDIGLHVDCCLGGFYLPFIKKLGLPIPEFDFALPGVTSMSMDTHKYGYTLKGSSVILYRTTELRHSQYFCYADWTGGMYTTATVAGSRSGGLIAQCWASMIAMGEEGYMKHAKEISEVVNKIAEGVREIQGLKLLAKTQAMIVCFAASDEKLNIYSVCDKMTKKGWSLNALQNPPCVHICCTVTHFGKDEVFLADLKDSVAMTLSSAGGDLKEGKAAIYGMTSSLPAGPVNDLLKIYNDVVLKV